MKFGKYRRVRNNNVSVPAPPGLRWSDPAAWGGTIPQAGDNVTIPAGTTYLLDVDTANLGLLTLNGFLQVDPLVTNVKLTAKGIYGTGTGGFFCGTAAAAHPGKVTIELNGTRPVGAIPGPSHNSSNVSTGNPNDTFMGVPGLSRGIIWDDGFRWEVYCALPAANVRTRLNAAAAAAATALTTADSVAGWANGANVLVAPTGFYDNQHGQTFTLNGAGSGTSLTLNAGLTVARYGSLQYFTDTGIATSPGAFSTMKANALQRGTADQRAKIALLDRNFVIQCPVDSDWTNLRFGVHMMVMGLSSTFIMEGAKLLRCGQGGLLGRYPIHWHMLSYNPATGQTLGNADTTKHRVKDCVIWQSKNRGVTIHGTRGVHVLNNVCHDILGHGLFLEDGSEEDNIIEGNWVGGVRDPGNNSGDSNKNYRIKLHDATPAGFWVTNPNNQIRYNVGFDCQFVGFWNAWSYTKYWSVPASFSVGTPGTVNWTSHGLPVGQPLIYSTNGSAVGGLTNHTVYYVLAAGLTANSFHLGASPGGAAINFTSGGSGTHALQSGGCFGPSGLVPIIPFYTRPRLAGDGSPLYDDNESHSNGSFGMQTRGAVGDEQGTTFDFSAPGNPTVAAGDGNGPRVKLIPDWAGADGNADIGHQFNWKNQQGGYSNRIQNPRYLFWMSMDNLGQDFFGATMENFGDKILAPMLAGFSNNTESKPANTPNTRTCFASYHSSIDFIDVSAWNYPLGTPRADNFNIHYLPEAGAVMQSWDFYTRPVEMGTARHTNWKLYNSTGMYDTPPAHILNDLYDTWTGNQPMDNPNGSGWNRHWTLAGAKYDHNGVLGAPAGNYIIYDHPFLTTGLASSTVMSPPELVARYTTVPFYGVMPFGNDLVTNMDFTQFDYRQPMRFDRLDSSTRAVISGALWDIADGATSSFFPNMRHAAIPRDGWAKLTQSSLSSPNSVRFATGISNVKRVSGFDGAATTDRFFLALQWSGSVAPAKVEAGFVPSIAGSDITFQAVEYVDTGTAPFKGRAVRFASVASFAALNSATVPSYFRDTANNLLYLAIVPWSAGSPYNPTNVFAPDDSRNFTIIVHA